MAERGRSQAWTPRDRFTILAALAATLLVAFKSLVVAPGALIVDAERPAVDALHPSTTRPIGNDLTRLFLPRFLWMSEQVKQHARIPQWDPRGFAGRPNVGNPQAGLFYPPVRFAWMIGHPATLGWLTLVHLLGAGFATAELGRDLGLGRTPALVAGVVAMINPYMIAQVVEGHLPHIWAACWFPLAYLGALRARRAERWGVPLLSVGLAASLMAGHPQEGLYLGIVLSFWSIADGVLELRRGNRSRALARSARWALAFGLAIGLSAVEWLPDLRVRPWALALGGSSAPYHLHLADLARLLHPEALGGPYDYLGRVNAWETAVSIGVVSLVLAGLGAWRYADRRAARLWSLLVIVSLVHAFGNGLGLSRLLSEMIPLLGAFRVPARSLFLATLGASVLAGMGLQSLAVRLPKTKMHRYALMWIALVGLIEVALGLWAFEAAATSQHRPIGSTEGWSEFALLTLGLFRAMREPFFLMVSCCFCLILILGKIQFMKSKEFSVMIAFIVCLELSVWTWRAVPTAPAARFLDSGAMGAALEGVRPAGAFRIRAQDAFYTDAHAWRDGVEKTHLHDLFQIRHAAEVYRALDRIRGPKYDDALAQSAADRLGVAFSVSDRPLPPGDWSVVASGVSRGEAFEIRRNPTALPRAYVVSQAKRVAPGDAFRQLKRTDPRGTVLLTGGLQSGFSPTDRRSFRPARYRADAPDRIRVEVGTDGPGYLVIGNTWMPGWRAERNGRPAPLLRGDHAFQVVPFPNAGRHVVSLTYQAPGLKFASWISVLSLLGLLRVGRGAAPPWLGPRVRGKLA